MKIIKKIKQRFCNHIGKCACYRKGNRYIYVIVKNVVRHLLTLLS